MDASLEYINMCRKATELQEMWKLTLGDWFYYETSNSVTCIGEFVKVGDVYNATGHGNWKIGKNNSIWLPRIDQWLQMLLDEEINFGSSNYTQCDSVEITCLKLFYSNKYNKSWNGEDWI